MSPAAAVDFQPPITSKTSSSVQNPNLTPFSFTSNIARDQPFSSTNSNSNSTSSFGNDGVCGVGDGNKSRSGAVRGRPRFVKVRRQAWKLRTAAAKESGAEFNPFRSKVGDSGPVNCGDSNVLFSNNGVLDNSNRVSNSDEYTVSNDCSFVCKENVAFTFSSKRSDDSVLNSDSNSRKLEEAGFVFGAKNREENMYRQKHQLFETAVKPLSNDTCETTKKESEEEPGKLDKTSFAFVGNAGDVQLDLNMERKNTCESVVESGYGDEDKVNAKNEGECKNDGNVRFQFSANANDLCLNFNFNLENEKSSVSMKHPASDNIGCFVGVNQSDSVLSSNSEKGECNVNVGDSGLGFVFGTSWRNSASNSNLEESGSGTINDNTVGDDQGKMKVASETEPEKVEATEVRYNRDGSMSWSENYNFVFGGGDKKCYSTDEVKLNSKDFGNNVEGRAENDNLGFNVNDTNSSESGIGKVASSSSTDTTFKLPVEMEKLDINVCESVGDADKKKDSSKNFNANAGASFVFSSSIKPSTSNGISEPTQKQKTDPIVSVERVVVDNFGTDDNDHIISGKSFSRDSALFGNSISKPFTFQSELDKSSSCRVNSDTQTNFATSVSSFSSARFDSQPNNIDASMVGGQRKNESCPSTPDRSGVPCTEFIIPNWDPSFFKANLYPELNKTLVFNGKNRSKRDKRPNRTRGNFKQTPLRKQEPKQLYVPKQSSSQENPKSPECYSPMDFSPYMETPVADQPARKTSVTSNDPLHPDSNGALHTSHSSVSTDTKDDNLATAERIDINIGDQKFRERNEESLLPDGNCPLKTNNFGTETAYSSSKEEQVCNNIGATMASAKNNNGFNTVSHESVQNCFAQDRKYFTFSSSPSAEGNLTARKSQLRKKFKKKVGSSSVPFSPGSGSKSGSKSEASEQVKQDPISWSWRTWPAAFEAACEMWRLRGNEAYKNGYMSKAEGFYTQGINSVPSSETAGCCIKPLVLCYSNRAAARISLERIREALEDCLMAAAMDPNFLKAYARAANCHLVLGEVENAMQYYNKLLESGAGLCLDRRITIEAADGLQKAQKVAECTNRSAELLEQKTLEAASDALEIITEALSTSSRSEKLLEMKAEALCLLRKYEETIQLCEQTLCVAEQSFASVGTDNCSVNMNVSGSVNHPLARMWRWCLISKAYFYMGKLEAALDLLQKLEQVGPISNKQGKKILESSISLAATIRELLLCKNAGNEAFRSGKFTEAVEHYTVALSSNVESRPFAAICFCNRAAAHQALGHIADAIADCSLSMAIDGNYTKAVSRRAVLHEMIRDSAQAASDLQRLISTLENQSKEKAKQSGSPARSTGNKDIKQARRHMSLMEEEAKEGVPLDFYLILGVKASDAASDIKKAYRKAALRHHPDKASQFLGRTESGDEGRLWKEIADEVNKDADRLFKMIGEAYAILSDTAKRSEYDHEEEMRKAMKEIHRTNSYGRTSDAYRSSFRRSANKQNSQENWKTYGNSHSRW
ncbi:hypothetical protein Dsin_011916 [Dipteronia sinensis]|uniref:J domain-containing protein n=1 Tax=Dipteronia sinensis TaxID=43782 RepID=A0AAE0AH33_9ROSI|nr:hypothetical protein Dsin_011916 [Dipteronia sinensis]